MTLFWIRKIKTISRYCIQKSFSFIVLTDNHMESIKSFRLFQSKWRICILPVGNNETDGNEWADKSGSPSLNKEFTYLLTYLLTFTYLLTYLLTCLLTFTYLFTYLLSYFYLLTYLLNQQLHSVAHLYQLDHRRRSWESQSRPPNNFENGLWPLQWPRIILSVLRFDLPPPPAPPAPPWYWKPSYASVDESISNFRGVWSFLFYFE